MKNITIENQGIISNNTNTSYNPTLFSPGTNREKNFSLNQTEKELVKKYQDLKKQYLLENNEETRLAFHSHIIFMYNDLKNKLQNALKKSSQHQEFIDNLNHDIAIIKEEIKNVRPKIPLDHFDTHNLLDTYIDIQTNTQLKQFIGIQKSDLTEDEQYIIKKNIKKHLKIMLNNPDKGAIRKIDIKKAIQITLGMEDPSKNFFFTDDLIITPFGTVLPCNSPLPEIIGTNNLLFIHKNELSRSEEKVDSFLKNNNADYTYISKQILKDIPNITSDDGWIKLLGFESDSKYENEFHSILDDYKKTKTTGLTEKKLTDFLINLKKQAIKDTNRILSKAKLLSKKIQNYSETDISDTKKYFRSIFSEHQGQNVFIQAFWLCLQNDIKIILLPQSKQRLISLRYEYEQVTHQSYDRSKNEGPDMEGIFMNDPNNRKQYGSLIKALILNKNSIPFLPRAYNTLLKGEDDKDKPTPLGSVVFEEILHAAHFLVAPLKQKLLNDFDFKKSFLNALHEETHIFNDLETAALGIIRGEFIGNNVEKKWLSLYPYLKKMDEKIMTKEKILALKSNKKDAFVFIAGEHEYQLPKEYTEDQKIRCAILLLELVQETKTALDQRKDSIEELIILLEKARMSFGDAIIEKMMPKTTNHLNNLSSFLAKENKKLFTNHVKNLDLIVSKEPLKIETDEQNEEKTSTYSY